MKKLNLKWSFGNSKLAKLDTVPLDVVLEQAKNLE
jgi:hypothetical protein